MLLLSHIISGARRARACAGCRAGQACCQLSSAPLRRRASLDRPQALVKYPGSTVMSVAFAAKAWDVPLPEYNPVHYNAPTTPGVPMDPPTVVMCDRSVRLIKTHQLRQAQVEKLPLQRAGQDHRPAGRPTQLCWQIFRAQQPAPVGHDIFAQYQSHTPGIRRAARGLLVAARCRAGVPTFSRAPW